MTPPATEFPLSGLTDEENKQALASSCEEYKVALFLIISKESKYGAMKKKLDNLHLFEQDAYPKTLEKEKTYLENCQAKAGNHKQNRQPGNMAEQGVAFVQQGNGQVDPCHSCGKMGHLIRNCPDLMMRRRKLLCKLSRTSLDRPT